MNAFALLALVPLLAAAEPAQPATARDVLTNAKIEFQKGNFRQTLAILEAASGVEFNPVERFDSGQLQALSHVYLGEPKLAQEHFRELLLINPDYFLDPLVYGEEARNVVVATRNDPELQPKLDVRREELRQARLREAEMKKLAEEAEKRRKELAAIPEQVPVVVRHNVLLSVVPFGVPQIEQNRVLPAVLFAVAQGVTLTSSVLTYWQVDSYIDKKDGKVEPDRLKEAQAWRTANWISVGAAAAVYAAGVVDAFIAHKDETIKLLPREEYLKLRDQGVLLPAVPPTVPVTPPPAEPKTTPAPSTPKPEAFFLSPLPGGAAIGIAGSF